MSYDYGLHEPQPTLPPSVPEPAPAPNRNRRYLLLGGALALVVIVVVAIVALTGSSDRPLKVSIALFDLDGSSDCSGGTGGYNDIGPGMPVTVKDETGKIIGSGSLPEHGKDLEGLGCEWSISVIVPDDAKQYAVEGGDRGAVTYSRAQLDKDGWKAELSIGGPR